MENKPWNKINLNAERQGTKIQDPRNHERTREAFIPKKIIMLSRTAIILIKVYQVIISPYLGRNCRFYPTCSNYALQAYQEYGFIEGTILTLKRLFKCGMWHPGGYDPLPERREKNNEVKE